MAAPAMAQTTPTEGAVTLGDTEEGTMAVRINEALRVTHGKNKDKRPGTGALVNAAGDRGIPVWGKRAAWCDASGPLADGRVIGVALLEASDDVLLATRQGKAITKGYLYRLLANKAYIGEAVHKGTSYPGEHHGIITLELWDQVQSILQESPRQRAANTRTQTPALLKGLIFTANGVAMTPTATKKGSRHYRYYTSMDAIRNRAGEGTDGFVRLNAGMVEGAVIQHHHHQQLGRLGLAAAAGGASGRCCASSRRTAGSPGRAGHRWPMRVTGVAAAWAAACTRARASGGAVNTSS